MPKFGGFLKKNKKKKNSPPRESTVQFDESSNTVNQLPPLSPSQKLKLWVSKDDVHNTRQQVHREAILEQAEELVRKAAVKDLGNFVTQKKLDQKVQQVLNGGPDAIRAYVQEHDSDAMESMSKEGDSRQLKAIRKSVKSKVVTDEIVFLSAEDVEQKVNAIMELPHSQILKFLQDKQSNTSDNDDSNDSDDSDDSDYASSEDEDSDVPKAKNRPQLTRGMSKRKSQAITTLEEAMLSVPPKLQKQIKDALEDKNKGIDSLEEALDDANHKYLKLKDKQRQFIAVQEELEALARRQMRQIEKMQRQQQQQQTPSNSSSSSSSRQVDKGLQQEVEDIEALREALDQANEKTTTLKSKDRKLVAVGEELESLCRKQQAQLESSEKDHLDRLKAKDTLNESLKDQLKDAKHTIQEKDLIIAMLQQRKDGGDDDNDDIDSQSDGPLTEDIQDELVANLEAKDELIESLRTQLSEVKKMGREKDEEIKALERKLREAKQNDPSALQQQQQTSSSTSSSSVQKLEQKIQTLKEREEKNDDLMEKMEEQLDEADEALQNAQAELEEANERVGELEEELRHASPGSQQQQQSKSTSTSQQQEQLESQARDNQDEKSNAKELERKLKRAESQQKKAEDGLQRANRKIEELNRKLDQQQDSQQQPQQQVQQSQSMSRSEQNTQIERSGDDNQEVAKLQKQLEKANERIEALRAKLNLANATIKDLQAEGRTAGQEMSHHDKELLKQKDDEVDSLKNKLTAANETIQDLEDQWNQKPRADSDVTNDSITSIEKEIRMKEKDETIMALEQEIEQLASRTGGKRELDSNNDDGHSSSSSGKQSLMDQLEEKDTRIASLEDDLEYANRLIDRFENVRGVPDDVAIARKLKERETEIEKLRQQLKNSNSAAPGVDRKSIMIRQEKQDALLEKMEEQLEEAEQSLEAKEKELDQLKADLLEGGGNRGAEGGSAEEIANLQSQVSALERDLRSTVKDRDRKWLEKDGRIEELEQELIEAKREAELLEEKLERGPLTADEKDEAIAKLEKQVASLERDLRSTVKDRDRKWLEKDGQIEELEEALAQAKSQADSSLEDEMRKKLEDQLELVQKLLRQLESSEAVLDEQKSAIEEQDEKARENEALIRSLQRETEKQKKAPDLVSLGTDPDVMNNATLRADLEITERARRKTQERLNKEMDANKENGLKILSLENKLADKADEMALKEKQIELSSMLEDKNRQLKRSLDSNRKTLQDKENQIRSLQRKKLAAEKKPSGVISKGGLDHILEAANLNAKVEDLEDKLKKEQAAHKKARRKMQKLDNERSLSDSGESKSDLQQKLDHQTQMTASLRNQLETAKISIDTKGRIIESLAEELGDKDTLVRNWEAQVNSMPNKEDDSDEKADLLRRLQKEQLSKEKAKRKYHKLQGEMDGQMRDWAMLEREMDDAKARVNNLESRLADEMANRPRGDTTRNNDDDDFNLYLDGLTRKVRTARSQLEAAQGRLDQTVGRYRVAPQ